MSSNPVLSICIPTFNRCPKIHNLVLEILAYSGDEIEIVVNDNHSNDNTKIALQSINDKRLTFYENSANVGAFHNGLIALKRCKGKYVMVCLDKDKIHHQYIEELIQFLNNHDVSVGFCNLNYIGKSEFFIYTAGFVALSKVGYREKHPSGVIMRNGLLHSLNLLNKFPYSVGYKYFIMDFIMAELCLHGDAAILNFPICSTEKSEDAKKSKSLTYSAKFEELFFSPNKKFELLQTYINHIRDLDIEANEKSVLVKSLFRRGLLNSTFGFRSLCSDKSICEHYDMAVRNVGVIEMMKIDLSYCIRFIQSAEFKNKLYRMFLCFDVHLHIINLLTKKAISNFKGFSSESSSDVH